MDGNSIIIVKGTSGSGKSTRVYLLLDFLQSLGVKLEPFLFKTIDGKEKQVGLYSEDFNMLFVGGFYEYGKIKRWQGYDNVTGKICGAEGLSYFLKGISDLGIDILIEGSVCCQTNRLKPYDLYHVSGYKNIMYVRYDYSVDGFQDYKDRIYNRAGNINNREDSFDKNNRKFFLDCRKAEKEAEEVNKSGGNVVVYDRLYNCPVWDLGVNFFRFLGLEFLIDDYKTYCDNSTYIEDNNYFKNK